MNNQYKQDLQLLIVEKKELPYNNNNKELLKYTIIKILIGLKK